MKTEYSQIAALALTVIGLSVIAFLYWTEPRTLAEVSTRGQVVLGTYESDRSLVDQGIRQFKTEQFEAARDSLMRADPEKRDAVVHFYIAYSYYRQGWGLISNDDTLFKAGVEAVDRVIAIDPSFRISDDSLKMKTAFELKAELDEGLNAGPSLLGTGLQQVEKPVFFAHHLSKREHGLDYSRAGLRAHQFFGWSEIYQPAETRLSLKRSRVS